MAMTRSGTREEQPQDVRRARTASRLAWGLFALGIAAFGLLLYLEHLTGSAAGHSIPLGSDVVFLPVFLSFASVGVLVVSRQPRNPVGWLMLSFVVMPLGLLAGAWANYSLTRTVVPGSAAWAGVIFEMSIVMLILPLVLTMLLFPHGEPPSPRWRVVVWLAGITTTVGVLSTAIADVNFHNNFPHLQHPFQLIPAAAMQGIYGASQLIGSLLFVVAAAALVVRYRSAVGEERAQIKWIAFGAAVVGVGLAVWAMVAPFGMEPVDAFIVLVPLIPIGAGIGILKYRLYDIDVVISKTIVYGALAAFIAIVYVAIVVGVGLLIGSDAGNPALSIAATGVVALTFQAVRDRVQRFANRLVYGDRATPYEVLTHFSERVGSTYATEDILPRTVHVIAEGVNAERATIWLRLADELRPSATWPVDARPDEPRVELNGDELRGLDADHVAPIRYRAELLGAITIDKPRGEPMSPEEVKLVDDLAAQAGLVVSNVRLTADLEARLDVIARQADELRASRQRIVAAQDEERRRLERNIHDGAQQHLVALAVKLRLTRGLLTRDPERARPMLNEIGGQIDEALETLRSLAWGIYPPRLESEGVGAALAARFASSGLPVRFHTDGVGRYPIDTEAAVYFCVLEALQNAAKYAGARAIDVALAEREGALTFEVSDDGAGFDPGVNGSGTGLQGMRDRLAVLGGDVTLRSAPGQGAVVRGRVPLAAEVTA